jgi:hypothetical protein
MVHQQSVAQGSPFSLSSNRNERSKLQENVFDISQSGTDDPSLNKESLTSTSWFGSIQTGTYSVSN